MTQLPPPTTPGALMRPHRGTAILVMGILALVINFGCGIGWILGIISWVMGNADLKTMDAGLMDPSGRGITQAGKVCGMISVILAIIGVLIYVLLMILGISLFAFGAGSQGTP